jgi:hypothetical protein
MVVRHPREGSSTEGEPTMRFMLIMYPGAKAEGGSLPDEKTISAMMKYNEDLTKAGVLLSLDGLHPSAKGAENPP